MRSPPKPRDGERLARSGYRLRRPARASYPERLEANLRLLLVPIFGPKGAKTTRRYGAPGIPGLSARPPGQPLRWIRPAALMLSPRRPGRRCPAQPRTGPGGAAREI